MKPSGKHKHDKQNELGEHTHDYEELDDEGLKLIVKGKLKNLPNFSFKKPKTEKQKKEAEEKKEEKKKNKKEQLNELIDTIENNFSKFQSKKQIAQQTSGSNIPIPIYIPQYTQPTGKNLNVETLSEINDMILKKENELKQYYEREYKKSFTEVDKQYSQMQTQTEPDEEYERRFNELTEIYNKLIQDEKDLENERKELLKKGNITQQQTDEYNKKLQELDDIYNKLLRDEAELKRERQELEQFRIEEERKAIGDTTSISLPDVPKRPTIPPLDLDVLELFGTPREEIESFETPRGEIELTQPQLTLSSQTDFQPLALPPPLPMPSIPQLTPATEADEFIPPSDQPKLSEGFELIDFEEAELPTRRPLITTQEEEEEPARPITQDVVDLLDILDDTIISKFKQSQPYLQLEDRADRAEQERDKAQEQILELQNTMGNIEKDLLELGQQETEMREADKAVIEEELRLKVREAEEAETQNDRKLALKEAEILENKLQGAIQSKELRDELEKLKEETKKELELKEREIEELKLIEQQQNMLLRGRDESAKSAKKIQSDADAKIDRQKLIDLGLKKIPKDKDLLGEYMKEINEIENETPEKLNDIIRTANSMMRSSTTIRTYLKNIQKIRKENKPLQTTFGVQFTETEEEKKERERKEKEQQTREEEMLKPFDDAIDEIDIKIKQEQDKLNEIEKDINEIDFELEDIIKRLEQYDNIFEKAGIKNENDIEEQGEPERQLLKNIFKDSIIKKQDVNVIQEARKRFIKVYKTTEDTIKTLQKDRKEQEERRKRRETTLNLKKNM